MPLFTLYFTTTSKPFFFKKFSSIVANVVSSSTKRILAMGKRLKSRVSVINIVYRTVKNLFYFIDDCRRELACFQKMTILHLIKKVDRHGLIEYRSFQCRNNQFGSFSPADVFEEHHPTQNNRRRIHTVRICKARGGAVRCLEYGVPRLVIDVCSGRYTDSAHNCRECIRYIVAVEI